MGGICGGSRLPRLRFRQETFSWDAGFAMEEPSLQDSREDLFYTTTETDLFEYTPYQIEQREGFSFLNKFSAVGAHLLNSSYRFLLISTVAFSYTLLDFAKFTGAFILYLKLKFVSSIIFLEASKDRVVRTLMWRRGLLFRPATHGGVIALSAIAIIAGGLFSRSDIAAQDLTMAEGALTLNNTPETIVPLDRPRAEVIKYEVVGGDTLSEIAEKFEISVSSVRWANDLSDKDTIRPGDILNIPPVSGVIHKVKKGETIKIIAKKYKANPQTIADFPFNYIDYSLALQLGQTLIVPGGVKPKPVVVPVPGFSAPANRGPSNYGAIGSGLFARPILGPINQYPSWWHPGIDIGADYGAGVYAAGGGRVITANRQAYGFGWHIFIDHGNGYVTAYAHLSGIKVNVGQNISKGQLIGAVGCTGRCTGSHLHFEVRRGGASINPLSVL